MLNAKAIKKYATLALDSVILQVFLDYGTHIPVRERQRHALSGGQLLNGIPLGNA